MVLLLTLVACEPSTDSIDSCRRGLNRFSDSCISGSTTSAVTIPSPNAANNAPPTLSSITLLTGTSEDTAYTLSYATLASAADEADPDGDSIHFLVTAVYSGSLTKNGVAAVANTTLLSSGETLVWTPAANANGTVTAFTIKAWDGTAASSSDVQVDISVAPVNDSPTLGSITGSSVINEDSGAQTLSFSGIGPGGGSDESSQSLTVTAVSSNPTLIPHPTVSYTSGSSTGTLSYTPVANANGTANLTVTVSDGQGSNSTATRTFSVSVISVNDPPTLTAISTLTGGIEDTAFTITFAALATAANEADIDSAYVLFLPSGATTGSLTQGGSPIIPGTTLLTPTSQPLVWTPATNANGSLTAFTVRSYDGSLASATPIPVVVTTAAVNDAPTGNSQAFTTSKNTSYSGTLTGSDIEGSALSYIKASDPAHGTVAITNASTGAFSYTPNNNFTGSDSFTFKVNDGLLDSVPVTVSVTVVNSNTAPTLSTISNLAGATEDTAYTISHASLLAASDAADIDGTTPEFLIDAVSSGTLSKAGVAVTAGATRLASGESIVWTPAANANGTLAAFTVKAYDGALDSGTPVQVNVVVTAINDAPTLSAISNPSAINEDASVQTVNLTGIGPGGGTYENAQTLTVTATSSNTSLIPNPTVSYSSPNATGSLSFTPVADAFGTATITVTVNDGQAASNTSSQTFTVTVNAVNDPPTLSAISNPAAISANSPQQTVSLTGISSGPANEAAQTITVSAVSSNTSLIPNPTVSYTSPNSTGSLSYTPVAGAAGSATITVSINDGQAANHTFQRSFNVTVNSAVPTLSYSGSTGTTGYVGSVITVSPTTLYTNGAPLTACAIKAATTALPAWASINATTCVISGTPNATLSSTNYTVVATNSVGTSANAVVALTITPAPPSGLTYNYVNPLYTQYSTLLNNSPSSSGGAVTSYSITPALPSGITLNGSTGVISGTPSVRQNPGVVHTITATNAGGSTTTTITITVNENAPNSTYSSIAVGTATDGNPYYDASVTNFLSDGSTKIPVTITLKDSGNVAMRGVTPAFGSGYDTGNSNINSACSSSNSSGLSYCYMTTKIAETKALAITSPISKNGPSVPVISNYSIEVPIEFLPVSVRQSTASAIFWNQFSQNLYPTHYVSSTGGTKSWFFEATCTNSDTAARSFSLIKQGSGATFASVSIPAGTTSPTRVRAAFSATPGAADDGVYTLKSAAVTSGNLTCNSARVLVRQTRATQTKIYVPLISGPMDTSVAGLSSVSNVVTSGASTYNGTVDGNTASARFMAPITTSTTPGQGTGSQPDVFSVWKKVSGVWNNGSTHVQLVPVFDLEVNAANTTLSQGAKVGLYYGSTGLGVQSLGTANTNSFLYTTFGGVQIQNSSIPADTALTVKVAAASGTSAGTPVIYKAGLWVHLTALTSAEVYYQVGRYTGTVAAGGSYLDTSTRASINAVTSTGNFKNPTVFMDVTGRVASAASALSGTISSTCDTSTWDSGTPSNQITNLLPGGVSLSSTSATVVRSGSNAMSTPDADCRVYAQGSQAAGDTGVHTSTVMVIRSQ